jgi:hypothetical protein
MGGLKKLVGGGLKRFGYEIVNIKSRGRPNPPELSESDLALVAEVLERKLTMGSFLRLVNTLKACRYVVENDIPGDFVECGVWRGGHSILAKKIFQNMGSKKRVLMFDTFEGMVEPTDEDVATGTGQPAMSRYASTLVGGRSDWCHSPLDDVWENCRALDLDMSGVDLIKGDVMETLSNPQNLPDHISVLRLDTDWYQSTRRELEVLYPVLSAKGVLIIDDYGHWDGSRKAVDDYFATVGDAPLFNVVDYTARSAVKT